MAEIPVEIISSGYTCHRLACAASICRGSSYPRVRIDGTAVDIKIVLCEHLRTLVDSSTGTVEDSAQHVLGHAQLQAVASELDFGLRWSTLCPLVGGDVCTFFTSIPEVPSNTYRGQDIPDVERIMCT